MPAHAEGPAPATALAQRIGLRLRDAIMAGRLAPGVQLVEVELAARYGASRNTIREVLHQLGSQGLATFVRHKGVIVRRMQRRDLREIYAARRALELQALTGGQPFTPARLARMRAAIDATERALAGNDWRRVGTLGLRVHQQIVAQLGSRLLDEFFRTLCAQLRLVFSAQADESRIQNACDWIARERQMHAQLLHGQRAAAAQTLAAYLDDSEQALADMLGSPDGRQGD